MSPEFRANKAKANNRAGEKEEELGGCWKGGREGQRDRKRRIRLLLLLLLLKTEMEERQKNGPPLQEGDDRCRG